MPHLSKEKIDDTAYKQLFVELQKVVAQATQKNVQFVLSGLLTPTEQVMLTKRLAAAMLYKKGCSQYEVWQLLKISPSTASRLQRSYKMGDYDQLLKVVHSHASVNLLDMLEVVLSAGLPPRGKGRWKSVLNAKK